MTEEVREALMRLTMCAREECEICKHKDECGYDMQCELATQNMNIVLNALESRPKGKWKHLGETIKAVTLEMHQCSECGYVVLTRSEFNQESYCPNCGVDMRGEE